MPNAVVHDEAFVSLVTNNSYGNGALVLGSSLRRVHTTRKLVLLMSRGVSDAMREKLSRVWDHIENVDILNSQDTANLALLTRPELGITFTKIHCWNLTQYRKCVFLDADTLVVKNCDELFERRELSAVPDVGWPDCFNSGVFVFEPSTETYNALIQHAVEHGSFDGGDQGLLNSFFSNWRTSDLSRILSFIYNMNSNASYSYAPAFKRFGKDVKIVHFLGPLKPWHYAYNQDTGSVYQPSACQGILPHELQFLQLWWDIYFSFMLTGVQNHGYNNASPGPQCSFISIQSHPDQETDPSHLDQETEDITLMDDHEHIPPHSPPHSFVSNLSQSNQETEDTLEELSEDMADMHMTDTEQEQEQDQQRRDSWESGRIDYMGQDRFENIEQRMDSFINGSYRNVSDVPGLV